MIIAMVQVLNIGQERQRLKQALRQMYMQ